MITLASDFGSPYPAAMKGVLLSETDARLVDVAHDFPRQDVRTGAFWLREVLPYFPPAVHLVVIDPGVGTGRRVLAVEAGDHWLVGPDNGILVPVAERLADSPRYFATTPENPKSTTFHGRDVFAPLAARLHEEGRSIVTADRFEQVTDVEAVRFPDPEVDASAATGEVLAVDRFGNAITNVPGNFLEGRYGDGILVDGRERPVVRTYGDLPPGEPLVSVGSHGNVELAVNQGRGEAAFEVSTGDTVYLASDEDQGDR
jgi:S-adenosylmethionine hydrolase